MTGVTDPPELESVRRVLRAHRATLMGLPHVVGVGVGRPDPAGPYVIAVSTDRELADPQPRTLDHVPLVWTATGPLRLQGGP